jgi:catechol 2,3-dioxygenase-like lactoylglutathione lyase family enzyme
MLLALIPKLPAKSLDETADFYAAKLGFRLVSRYPDYLILARDGAEVHFYPNPLVVPSASDHQVYIRMQSGIDDLYRTLLDNGAARRGYGDLETKPWGQREFAITDPNGHALTFGQPEPQPAV